MCQSLSAQLLFRDLSNGIKHVLSLNACLSCIGCTADGDEGFILNMLGETLYYIIKNIDKL